MDASQNPAMHGIVPHNEKLCIQNTKHAAWKKCTLNINTEID